MQNGRKVRPVAGKSISANQSVTLGKESALILIDSKKNKMYSLTSPGTNKVSEMIKSGSGSIKP